MQQFPYQRSSTALLGAAGERQEASGLLMERSLQRGREARPHSSGSSPGTGTWQCLPRSRRPGTAVLRGVRAGRKGWGPGRKGERDGETEGGMEAGILVREAVTCLLRSQATAAPFEESKAAAVPRRYLRSRELRAGHEGRECPAVPRTDVERRAVARAPLPATSVSAPSLPCPGAQAGTGAGAGLGMDTAVRASVRRRKDGTRRASPALLPAFPCPGGR
ncbi:uncharacterized protein LOC141728856 isoform X1 [Zonotrichia albicollis]|uniref:uncharacterized protein LOC141728856 isoform X1 n=1 Tax=Zonotrichia albicollis TaxID=44394 RepID=UPI003D810037